MSDTVTETSQVGSTLELEADTKYVNLANLTNWRIYYKQPGRATAFLVANIVAGSTSKLEATLSALLNVVKGKMRVWAYAEGPGGVVFKGKRKFILIEDPEG